MWEGYEGLTFIYFKGLYLTLSVLYDIVEMAAASALGGAYPRGKMFDDFGAYIYYVEFVAISLRAAT